MCYCSSWLLVAASKPSRDDSRLLQHYILPSASVLKQQVPGRADRAFGCFWCFLALDDMRKLPHEATLEEYNAVMESQALLGTASSLLACLPFRRVSDTSCRNLQR